MKSPDHFREVVLILGPVVQIPAKLLKGVGIDLDLDRDMWVVIIHVVPNLNNLIEAVHIHPLTLAGKNGPGNQPPAVNRLGRTVLITDHKQKLDHLISFLRLGAIARTSQKENGWS
ncbi:MAG TPA: hypothetical protein VJA87_01150 [Candidatus Paceibacterota bacterium]